MTRRARIIAVGEGVRPDPHTRLSSYNAVQVVVTSSCRGDGEVAGAGRNRAANCEVQGIQAVVYTILITAGRSAFGHNLAQTKTASVSH